MFKIRKRRRTACVLSACIIVVVIIKSVVLSSENWYKQTATPPRRNEQRRETLSRGRCRPRKNIVFVKTHKTGSSTVTNILHRHGDQHNLVFALPRSGQNRLDWPWMMQNSSFELPSGTPINIVCHHGRYNRMTLEKLMPRDTVYVTILRHPILQYESTFHYMAFEKLLGIEDRGNPMEYFLERPKKILVNYLLTKDLRVNSDRLKLIRNGMSFDLGLNSTFFDNEVKVKKFLGILKKQFDLVMIAEYFEESMVLLKDILCWPLEDFSYFNLNVRHKNGSGLNVSRKISDTMRRWNNVDFKVYRQFLRIFRAKISGKGRLESGVFHAETEKLRGENKRLRELCLRNIGKTRTVQYGVEVKRLELNGGLERDDREMCDKMRRNEVDYMKFLRAKQSGFFESMIFARMRSVAVGWLRILLGFLS